MKTEGMIKANKEVNTNNPIAALRFTADPYAIEYDGTVYVYGTNDSEQMEDASQMGGIPKNDYTKITSLNCYSSKDMVNWTDEGVIRVAGENGPAKWATNCWAPAVTYKKINGMDKFFIYFADNGGGIGVIEGESPTGPWRDPIGKGLITKNTPTCSESEVPWLFDPAVLMDDDGQAYIYFGGVGDKEDREHPKCTRVAKLRDDMISLDGEPVIIDAPAPFEDSGINKINEKYYYSYCTNFSSGSERPTTGDLGIANIAYMVSKDPLGTSGWSEAKVVLNSPTSYYPDLPSNDNNNNHHCIFQRSNGKVYILYHTQKMAAEMGIIQGYRTTCIDEVTVHANGELSASMTREGITTEDTFDPYRTVAAGTFAWAKGVSAITGPEYLNHPVLSVSSKGDHVGLHNVDFGSDGAKTFMMKIASADETGTVKIYLDSMEETNLVGELDVTATGSVETYKDMRVNLIKPVTGTHRVFFVFDIKDIFVDTWTFHKN